MVKHDPDSGFRGLRQIRRSMMARGIDVDFSEEFAKHTLHFIERCYPDWIRGNNGQK